jgi:TPR repeat protein
MPAKPTTRRSDSTHVGQDQPTRAQHARYYAFWVERFQSMDGDFLSRARRIAPPGDFEQFAVGLALALQRKRDKDLKGIGIQGMQDLAATGCNLARYNVAVQQQSDPDKGGAVFAAMSAIAESESNDPYLKGLAIAGVGECYLYARGVERDVAKAHELFEQAAEHDVAGAAFAVGLYHDDKEYDPYRGPVDFEKAARFYKMAADLGDIAGMTNLGILYATRRLGVDKVEEGWSLLERASAEGDAVAARTMAALGSIEAVQGAASSSDLTSLLFTRF